MNSSINDQTNLGEPHFDEEATILAARPVVPLDDVRPARRSKAGLAVALAVAGGLIIGLLAATLIFRYFNVSQPAAVESTPPTEPAVNSVDEPVIQAADGGVAAITDEEAPVPSEDENSIVEAEETDEAKPQESTTVRTTNSAPQVESRPRIIVSDPRPSSEEEEENERAIRRAERQQERRERRRAARRQQREDIDGNEDLSRIREIFEGAPRP